MSFHTKFDKTAINNWSEVLDKTIDMIHNSRDYIRSLDLKKKERRVSFTGKHQKVLNILYGIK